MVLVRSSWVRVAGFMKGLWCAFSWIRFPSFEQIADVPGSRRDASILLLSNQPASSIATQVLRSISKINFPLKLGFAFGTRSTPLL